MADSKIEWCDKVWNPTVGCEKVSQGCKNCYAERMAARLAKMRKPEYLEVVTEIGDHWNGHVKCLPERLDQPTEWMKPKRIFVDSMSDLFHPEVPVEFIRKVWETMRLCQWHTFIILTKRPAIMARVLRVWAYEGAPVSPNVWLGVSVEDQQTADERIPWLLQTLAPVRFLSVEPMLGPVDISKWHEKCPECGETPTSDSRWRWEGQNWAHYHEYPIGHIPTIPTKGLDWVICGGESGPHARPMHPEWARSIRSQCVEAGVPFFFKQWGEWLGTGPFDPKPLADVKSYEWNGGYSAWRVGKKAAGNLLDGQKWAQYPGGE